MQLVTELLTLTYYLFEKKKKVYPSREIWSLRAKAKRKKPLGNICHLLKWPEYSKELKKRKAVFNSTKIGDHLDGIKSKVYCTKPRRKFISYVPDSFMDQLSKFCFARTSYIQEAF